MGLELARNLTKIPAYFETRLWFQEQQAMISFQGMAEFYVYMNVVWLCLSKTLSYVRELFFLFPSDVLYYWLNLLV